MPSALEKARHGGVARVRTKRMPNGTVVRIYFYRDKKSYAERVKTNKKGASRGTVRARKGNARSAAKEG